ncbi:MAG: hypothetical protein MZV49_06235 [Rhodopseudomonas palustris]|nr:hypothetical protein [Rhodopseudomonas palustris]
MPALVSASGLTKEMRRPRRRRPHLLRHPGGGMLRLPGPERRRQDLDRAHDPLRVARDLGDADRPGHGRPRRQPGHQAA